MTCGRLGRVPRPRRTHTAVFIPASAVSACHTDAAARAPPSPRVSLTNVRFAETLPPPSTRCKVSNSDDGAKPSARWQVTGTLLVTSTLTSTLPSSALIPAVTRLRDSSRGHGAQCRKTGPSSHQRDRCLHIQKCSHRRTLQWSRARGIADRPRAVCPGSPDTWPLNPVNGDSHETPERTGVAPAVSTSAEPWSTAGSSFWVESRPPEASAEIPKARAQECRCIGESLQV